MPIQHRINFEKELQIIKNYYEHHFGKMDNIFDWDYLNNKFYKAGEKVE